MEYKKKKARTEHVCKKCGKVINIGDEYFSEERFLASLHGSQIKLCENCYQSNMNKFKTSAVTFP